MVNDPLGEALAIHDRHRRLGQGTPKATREVIVAAARNWHALTRHTEPAYEAVGRWYLSHYGIDFPASDAHAMLDAAVDALTQVTTESDE